jgi:exopolysaccharide biosynthesis polyprenyl glycosylphosphotransferase
LFNGGYLVGTLDPPCVDAAEEPGTAHIANDQWSIAVLLAADLLAAIVALPVALLLLSMGSPVESNSLSHFWRNVGHDSSFPVAIIVALALTDFYRSNRRVPYQSSFSELKELAIALCAGCVLSIGISVILHGTFDVNESNDTQLFLATIVGMALIIGAHTTLSTLRRGPHSRVLIVGSDPLGDRIATYVSLTKGVEVIGRVVDAPTADEGSLGTVADLPQLCEKYRANRIIVAFPTSMSHDSVTIFRSLPAPVHITIVPRYFELVSWRSRITDLFGLPLIEVAPAHFSLWDRSLKRGFDVITASLLLLVLSPLALIISVLVKLSSPGPVLFRQERMGRGRQVFTIYKFRTMVTLDAAETNRSELGAPHESIPLHELRRKAVDAHRITPIGAVMRRTGLDEIPQLLNVLLGTMSLVGPRPFTENESETLVGWEARRFDLRPGITGLWQVSGRNDLCLDDLRRLDYLYVASWSLWWDIKIVWDTPTAMVRGFGAY